MIQKLPPELRHALSENPSDNIRYEDELTRTIYVVVDEETHQRGMRALKEQEDWLAVQQGLKERSQGLGQPLAEVDAEIREELRLAALRKARGIWQDRDDLPDLATLRRELDRT